MDSEIRKLVTSDVPRIKEIDRALFSDAEQYDDGMYRRMAATGLSLVLVQNEVIVGYAFVQINPHMHVRSLAVHPSYQRRGYGRALMQAVIKNGESLGFE